MQQIPIDAKVKRSNMITINGNVKGRE